MRHDWIVQRAKQHYAEHKHWGVAFTMAYSDAAREWPLYHDYQYEEDAELQAEYEKDLTEEAEAQGVDVVQDLLTMGRQSGRRQSRQ